MGENDGTSCRFGSAKRELDKSLTYNVLLTLVSSIVPSFYDRFGIFVNMLMS